MDMRVFESMEAPELRQYLEFLLWHYRVVDAFWFLYVAERFDQPEAERLNERVWKRAGELGARDLISRFQIAEKGLEGFVKVLERYPWASLIGYQLEWAGGALMLSVPCCPVQEARLKRGLGEYVCKEMHRGEFESLAQAVDGRICVECLFAPPDPHPEGMFCRWRFSLAPELT